MAVLFFVEGRCRSASASPTASALSSACTASTAAAAIGEAADDAIVHRHAADVLGASLALGGTMTAKGGVLVLAAGTQAHCARGAVVTRGRAGRVVYGLCASSRRTASMGAGVAQEAFPVSGIIVFACCVAFSAAFFAYRDRIEL